MILIRFQFLTASYVGSSEHVWPWSSTECTAKSETAQLVSACHHATHYGFEQGIGRGSPEMDVFEMQPGNVHANEGVFLKSPVGQPFMSASFQVAPGRSANRPGPGEWPGPGQWYSGLTGGKNTAPNINFYGNYNSFRSDVHPALQDYWSDAISYNFQLNASFFTKPHVFRLEWEIPSSTTPVTADIDDEAEGESEQHTDGYLHWFVDGELVLAINGTGLREAGYGAAISSEPSYILFNTGISKQWGFPHDCPGNCPCKKYNCQSSDYTQFCGFSEGFCPMMLNHSSFDGGRPPEYKINWVRVYQNPSNSLQKVGCSTPERPTRRFIEAHADLYKRENDETPLRAIAEGRGVCIPPDFARDAQSVSANALHPINKTVLPSPQNCGGPDRGRCTAGRVCECSVGWTGPNCLAHDGYDPIVYDPPDTITDVGFTPPAVIPGVLFGGLVLLIVSLFVVMRRRHTWSGWSPIPDVVLEYEVNKQHSKNQPYQRQQRTFG
jgi:hypothetical protein